MSSSESESDHEKQGTNELKFIADQVRAHPVIIAKSKVPNVKKKKELAISQVLLKYKCIFGKELDSKMLLKKVNNMKTRLKNKTDLNKTGNKKIKLVPWEEQLLAVMQGESNPIIGRIEGSMQIGVKKQKLNDSGSLPSTSSNVSLLEDGIDDNLIETNKNVPPRKKSPLDTYETEETRKLTTKELQRLVLLQQLETSKLQKEYYITKIKKNESEQINTNTPTIPANKQTNIVLHGSNSYYEL